MGPNCPEKISVGFYKEAFLYNKKFRKKYYGFIKEHPEIEWIVLKNRHQVKKYLKEN